MLQRWCLVAMAGLCFGGLAFADIGSDDFADEKVLVPKITSVVIVGDETNQRDLLITVEGEFPTSGYGDGELVRIHYPKLPEDRIQGFQFTVRPPTGVGAQVVTTVKAEYRWKDFAKDGMWAKGFRVEGVGDGIVERLFNEDRSRKFVGESKTGDFQEALNDAIEKLRKATNDGTAADPMTDWKLVDTSGKIGGLAGLNTLTVTIAATRTPDWARDEARTK